VIVRPVAADEWDVVAWLWQDFRHDLGTVVNGFPYADGRYQHALLDRYPRPDGTGYLSWRPHPNTGADAPVAFALVSGVGTGRCGLDALFVVPAARRCGLGRRLALDVIGRHPGAWEVGFQHDSAAAGEFWRAVARDAWDDAWSETEEPVPGKPAVSPDHWLRTT
jgi:predicted acetyltransferase